MNIATTIKKAFANDENDIYINDYELIHKGVDGSLTVFLTVTNGEQTLETIINISSEIVEGVRNEQ